MLKNFFKIALRHLWRKKTYSILNYICLTFGLACAIITVLYIRSVLSYDKFHHNYDRLYAVDAYVTYFNGDRFPKEYLSASLSDVLITQSPEIEDITRIAEMEYFFISGDKTFTEKGIFADENFFKVFTFPLAGNEKVKMLTDVTSIFISERMAIKFFGNTNCIGKSLIIKDKDSEEVFNVSGVLMDVPAQSTMQFDFVIPFSKFLAENIWALETGATANQTWIVLKKNIDYKIVESKIRFLIKNQESTLNQELFLFPLKEHILYSYAGGKRVWKEMQNLVIIGTIGFAILLIACFNFINLAIALNIRRYREAGIKKVSGSDRSGIVFHFLGETLIITFISLFSGIILVRLLLPGFNIMFNHDIQLNFSDFRIIALLMALSILTGVISGLIPALYLASSNPINALKGKIISGHSYSAFRQTLIIFQFAIPIALIICMMIIRSQDSYMRNYYAGVEKDKVIIMENSNNIQDHIESFRAEMLAIPGIDAVSFTNCIPTRGAKVSSEVSWEGKDPLEKLHFWSVNSDFDYNKTVEIEMVEGRFFDPSYSTDSTAYLINNVASLVMKKTNPVGSSIIFEGRKGTIIGVFKDFHAIDLAGPLVPVILQIHSGFKPFILVKFSSGSYNGLTSQIEKIYRRYESERLFNATLFRDLIPYSNLNMPSRVVGLAFIIALLLACMGLFGIASFTSETRTKEIGIRKANGATTLSVMQLLLANYARWLIIAYCIALPVAFIFGKIFLSKFYFHTPIPLWAFIAGPAIAVAVALFTVITQTWRVASMNPVKSLRYE